MGEWRDTVGGGLVLAVVLALLFGWGLNRYPLWDVDEARHSEVAREMASGDGVARFLLPSFGREAYREKPPGYYWLVTIAYAVAGVTAGAARSVSAIAAWLTAMAVYAYAARKYGVMAGASAAVVTASCAGFVGLARYGSVDMTLAALTTLGVLSGFAWLDLPQPRRRLRGAYWAASLAVLVKGPVGALLVAGPLLLAALIRRTPITWRELGLGRGLAVVAGLVGGTAAAISVLDPLYLSEQLHTNLARFAADAPHAAPFYYYALWFPVLVLPWTVLAGPALARALRQDEQWPYILWLAFVLVLFSLPRGKLGTYVLPAIPAFGLLVGPALAAAMDADADEDDRWLQLGGWTQVVLLLLGMVAATVVGVMGAPLAPVLVLLGALSWWAVLTAAALRRDALTSVPPLVAAAMLTCLPLVVNVAGPFVGARNSDAGAAALGARMEVATVIAFRSKSPSMLFYSRAPVVHVQDLARVRQLFLQDTPVMLVTGTRHVAEVERTLGTLAHRWLDTGRRRTYGNRPLAPPVG